MTPVCVAPAQPFTQSRPPVAIEATLLESHPHAGLDEDRERVDRCLRAFLAESRRMHVTNSQVHPLFDHVAEFVLAGGKRLRPRIALASYRILGGSAENPPRGVRRAASSLELFHAFMLVHDDLIDGSLMRRDRPTLHEAIRRDSAALGGCDGRKRAGDLGLIGGDLLCALGMRLLARSGLDDASLGRSLRLVSDMLLETGIGEALDVLFEDCPLDSIAESQILDAYLRKTARYTVSEPLVMGASLAGADPARLKALRRFGDLVGLGFQIQNDLDGLSIDDESGECPDLDAGKRTWILWTAHERLRERDRRELNAALDLPIGSNRRAILRSLIEQSGALSVACERVSLLRREAITILRESRLDSSQCSALLGLVELFSPTTDRPTEARS